MQTILKAICILHIVHLTTEINSVSIGERAGNCLARFVMRMEAQKNEGRLETMRRKFLLVATVDHEIVFGELEIREMHGKPVFSASFDTVRPFSESDFDMEEYWENWLEDIDKDWKYDACERYNCKPSELASELAYECNDIRDAMDCSLYPETVEVNGNDWYFESGSCGQYDSRGDMEVYTNKEAYDLLHDLWDEYHLKEIGDDVKRKVECVEKLLMEIDEKEWIRNYIEEHENEF